MKKFIKMLTALVLSISTVVCAVIPAYAARGTSSTLYISDLLMAYGDTKEEAIKQLKEKEYIPVEVNLNRRGKDEDSSNKGKQHVYIGYKATTDPKNAITDIAAMSMDGDYKISMYEQVLHDSYDGMVKVAKYYENLAKAFKKNYEKGTDNANKAYDVLNMYSNGDVLDKDKKAVRMGDWFKDGELFLKDGKGGTWKEDKENKTRTLVKDPIVTMLSEANPDILNVLGTALSFAAASSSKTNNFYTRLAKLTQEEIDEKVASNELFEKADIILETVEALGSLIKKADFYLEILSDEVTESNEGFFIDETERSYVDAYTLSLYMKRVQVGNRTLYDIVTLDTITQQDLYPLIMAMTDGQFDAFVIGGSQSFFITELTIADDIKLTDEQKKEYDELYNGLKGYLQFNIDVENIIASKDPEENSAIDIFAGVDRSVFSGNVGVTENAKAAMALDPGRNPMFGNLDRNVEIGLLSGIAASLTTATVMAGFAAWQSKVASNLYFEIQASIPKKAILKTQLLNQQNSMSGLVHKLSDLNLDKAYRSVKGLEALPDTAIQITELENTAEALTKAMNGTKAEIAAIDNLSVQMNRATLISKGLTIGFTVAFGVMMIISAFYAGHELWNYYHPTYKVIPLLMMDKKTDRRARTDNYVVYNCVRTPDKEAGDVNAFGERQWIALYYTKDKNSGGSPLKINYQAGLASNFAPIHTFGISDGYNLNQFLYGSGHPPVNLSFEKGDRSLILATTFSEGARHALIASVNLVAGFGLAFGASMIVVKTKKKKDTLEA